MERKNIQESLRTFSEKIKKNHFMPIVVIALIGIVLLLFGSSFSSAKPNSAEKTVSSAAERIESKEIEKMLTHIPGVSKAYVLISYEDDGKLEYAYDYKEDFAKKEEGNVQENTDNKMVITRQNGDEKPVVVRQISPGIKGVTVIVQGTEETALKYKIYNAVKSALGVDAHKIEVILN
ncbi:hypothetical protein [Acetivibrio sp. MSJd-27]|jgi:stage III sporulation protein AG|uniref:hypothetical protein n=1 Tax=Acetivibrio sp. MSJd-27 TaxID=2841523 RepID=UPI0015A820A6|nr:hypothetical protein [Acetivibrio sp. MSJd-27]MBU5450163.1 hypothetical protein [Acetivibrio sp. MSJd-27]